MLVQDALIPGQAQWFHSALILFVRMTFATVIMAILFHRQLRSMGKNEGRQGIALGLFGGVGMLLQTDAQHVIQASTSAFFTQFTCIFVPIAVALRNRAWPTARVALSCFLVLFGCAALSGFSPTGVAFGRGEWETIAAAILFTGQILVLEKECYQNNEMRSTATMMFAVKANGYNGAQFRSSSVPMDPTMRLIGRQTMATGTPTTTPTTSPAFAG